MKTPVLPKLTCRSKATIIKIPAGVFVAVVDSKSHKKVTTASKKTRMGGRRQSDFRTTQEWGTDIPTDVPIDAAGQSPETSLPTYLQTAGQRQPSGSRDRLVNTLGRLPICQRCYLQPSLTSCPKVNSK